MKRIILSTAVVAVLFLGCSEETKDEAKSVANQSIDTVAKVADDSQQKATQIVKDIEEKTTPIVEKVTQKAKDVASEVSTTTVQVAQDIQKKVEQVTSKSDIDGKALYKSCAACHGVNGEKKALNSSEIIQGWDKEEIEDALVGYQNGTYGRAMSGVMKSQVTKYNQEQIEALAQYISQL